MDVHFCFFWHLWNVLSVFTELELNKYAPPRPPQSLITVSSSESNRPTRCFQGASTPVRACTARRWPRPTTPETAAHSRPPPPGLGTARCPKAIPASSPSASPSPRQTTWPNSTSPSHFWIKQKSTKGEAVKLSSVSFVIFQWEKLWQCVFFSRAQVVGLIKVPDGTGCEGEWSASAEVQIPQFLRSQPKGKCHKFPGTVQENMLIFPENGRRGFQWDLKWPVGDNGRNIGWMTGFL